MVRWFAVDRTHSRSYAYLETDFTHSIYNEPRRRRSLAAQPFFVDQNIWTCIAHTRAHDLGFATWIQRARALTHTGLQGEKHATRMAIEDQLNICGIRPRITTNRHHQTTRNARRVRLDVGR